MDVRNHMLMNGNRMARLREQNLHFDEFIQVRRREPPQPARSVELRDKAREFLTWIKHDVFDWNLKYALKLRGILHIIHSFLSVLTFATVYLACQMKNYDENGSDINPSYTPQSVTRSAISSFLSVVWCLKSKKAESRLLNTSFFLSMLTFAIIPSACQFETNDESCSYGFYCKPSYTFQFVAGSAFWSSFLLLRCLLSKEAETSLFSKPFGVTDYILYLTLIYMSSVALMGNVASKNTDRSEKEEHSSAILKAAKELETKEPRFKIFLKILGKAVLIAAAILGGIHYGVNMLGFRDGGVARGSLAALFQSAVFGRKTVTDCSFAALQRVGTAGLAVSTKFAVFVGSATAATLETIFN